MTNRWNWISGRMRGIVERRSTGLVSSTGKLGDINVKVFLDEVSYNMETREEWDKFNLRFRINCKDDEYLEQTENVLDHWRSVLPPDLTFAADYILELINTTKTRKSQPSEAGLDLEKIRNLGEIRGLMTHLLVHINAKNITATLPLKDAVDEAGENRSEPLTEPERRVFEFLKPENRMHKEKKSNRVTYDDIEYGTVLTRPTVSEALKGLKLKKLINQKSQKGIGYYILDAPPKNS